MFTSNAREAPGDTWSKRAKSDCVGGALAVLRLPDSAPNAPVTDEINITVLMSTIHHTHQAR